MAANGTKIYFPRDKKDASSNWRQLLAQGVIRSKYKNNGAINKRQSNHNGDGKEKKNQGNRKNGKQVNHKSVSKVVDEEEIWFDIDPKLLEQTRNPDKLMHQQQQDEKSSTSNGSKDKSTHGDKKNCGHEDGKNETQQEELVKSKSYSGLTKAVAMDCEMVGVGDNGTQSVLARVSIVNQFGHAIYDKFVKPIEPVTDYRTTVSGIRPQDLEKGEDFKVVQSEVYNIIKGRILVGHALKNDFKVLFIDHPKSKIRDTSKYFRKMVKGGGRPSLKRLTAQFLGVNIQSGEHDSVQDARAAMRLYTMYKIKWERDLKSSRKPKTSKP